MQLGLSLRGGVPVSERLCRLHLCHDDGGVWHEGVLLFRDCVSAAESSADSLLYPDDVRLCVLSAFLAEEGGKRTLKRGKKGESSWNICHSLWGICAAACGGFWGVERMLFTAVRASYRKKLKRCFL